MLLVPQRVASPGNDGSKLLAVKEPEMYNGPIPLMPTALCMEGAAHVVRATIIARSRAPSQACSRCQKHIFAPWCIASGPGPARRTASACAGSRDPAPVATDILASALCTNNSFAKAVMPCSLDFSPLCMCFDVLSVGRKVADSHAC